MLSINFDYLNFDNPEHRLGLIERSWDRSKDLIIFYELHKLKNWKSWLKGIYDTEGVQPRIIVHRQRQTGYIQESRRFSCRTLLSVPTASS